MALLHAVGFEWEKHPHRLHTLRVAPDLPGGIEVRGGPWTTGDRATDRAVPATTWTDASVPGELRSFGEVTAEGPGVAEATWPLGDLAPGAVAAVAGLTVTATSHPRGSNVAGFGVGVREREAFVRVEAAKVPERRERFAEIAFAAEVDLAVLDNGPDGAAGSLRVEHLAARRRTRGGFRPADEPVELAAGEGDVLGLAGWSWRVANTPRARGRYLRGFLVTATGSGATVVVSNRGEVTRPTVLDLAVDVVVRGPDAG
ncbi:MAG: hypothetical protein KDB10_04510 [Acidimicrobiales bacterium]|nr:hypothetical protein [Acidimicrobiales bacterium]